MNISEAHKINGYNQVDQRLSMTLRIACLYMNILAIQCNKCFCNLMVDWSNNHRFLKCIGKFTGFILNFDWQGHFQGKQSWPGSRSCPSKWPQNMAGTTVKMSQHDAIEYSYLCWLKWIHLYSQTTGSDTGKHIHDLYSRDVCMWVCNNPQCCLSNP